MSGVTLMENSPKSRSMSGSRLRPTGGQSKSVPKGRAIAATRSAKHFLYSGTSPSMVECAFALSLSAGELDSRGGSGCCLGRSSRGCVPGVSGSGWRESVDPHVRFLDAEVEVNRFPIGGRRHRIRDAGFFGFGRDVGSATGCLRKIAPGFISFDATHMSRRLGDERLWMPADLELFEASLGPSRSRRHVVWYGKDW